MRYESPCGDSLHRRLSYLQVNERKGYLLGDGLFCVSYGSVLGPTLQERALREAVWRKARPLFVPGLEL